MVSLKRRRQSVLRQTRRQRGAKIACTLALLTLGYQKSGHREVNADGKRRDALSWLSLSTSIFSFHVVIAASENQHHQASNNDEDNEIDLPRPLNYYEILDLETPDTHRSKAGKLHTRKKRANYRKRVTTDKIKKAYRRQAQLYHPDKASRHNMTTEEATSRFTEIADAYQALTDPAQRYEYDLDLLEIEEEYQEELLLLEEEQRERKRKQFEGDGHYHVGGDEFSLYEKIRNGAANFATWKETLNLDPWTLFEEFFFENSTMNDAEFDPSTEDYRRPNSYESTYHHRSPSPGHSQMPPRVSETTIHRGYDPSFGTDVFTVLRREEHIHDVNDNGEFYYRILGQDFISGTRVDPYTGFTMQDYYSAVTEPYFVEDGYSKRDSGANNSYGSANFPRKQNEQKATTPRKSPSRLRVGEFITPDSSSSDAWISTNGKYEAKLTRTCELQIRHRKKQDQTSPIYEYDNTENTFIWSSETFLPEERASGCFLRLNPNGRLVLSVDYGSGLGVLGNTVLWNSREPPVVPHWFQDKDTNMNQQPITFWYYASLDNDGVLAVYRVKEQANDSVDAKGKQKQDHDHGINSNTSQSDTSRSVPFKGAKSKRWAIFDKLGVMYHQISKSSAQRGQTKAHLAWDQLRYSMSRMFVGRPSSVTEKQAQTDSYSYHECVYSSSRLGCLAPGRNAIHLTKKVAHSLKRSVKSIDSHLDHFFSVLTEPLDYDDDINYGFDSNNELESFFDDDDEDILDTLIRVTGAAGVQVGKAGLHAAQQGMKQGKKVAGKMVGKMKSRMGKHSVRWGEIMTEKEDVETFF